MQGSGTKGGVAPGLEHSRRLRVTGGLWARRLPGRCRGKGGNRGLGAAALRAPRCPWGGLQLQGSPRPSPWPWRGAVGPLALSSGGSQPRSGGGATAPPAPRGRPPCSLEQPPRPGPREASRCVSVTLGSDATAQVQVWLCWLPGEPGQHDPRGASSLSTNAAEALGLAGCAT